VFSNGDGGRINPMVFARSACNLPLKDFHVPHALRRVVQKKAFETTMDNAFSKVIEECAKREDTWINLEIIESYTRLHELGSAHSVEAWKEGTLAGGSTA